MSALYSDMANTTLQDINDVHHKMFLKGNKDPEKLPPTKDALEQQLYHCTCKTYSTAKCLCRSKRGCGCTKTECSNPYNDTQ
jgi:hypothetical protein